MSYTLHNSFLIIIFAHCKLYSNKRNACAHFSHDVYLHIGTDDALNDENLIAFLYHWCASAQLLVTKGEHQALNHSASTYVYIYMYIRIPLPIFFSLYFVLLSDLWWELLIFCIMHHPMLLLNITTNSYLSENFVCIIKI